jgi:peptidoglycan/LPS O-acetylase OafA/YrhL
MHSARRSRSARCRPSPPQHPARLDVLDLLRGVAALLVLAGHLRAYLFQSYFDLQRSGADLTWIVKSFYCATALGHQAVMIFFALSGFLVGGKALDDLLIQRFSWSRYLLRRLTRLWIVIIPVLILTFLFDRAGMSATFGLGYDGRYYDLYSSGPGPAAIDHSLVTLLGNLLFLQTILVPTFGSNSPMWSLANEFWYYVIFPLAAWLCLARVSIGSKAIGFSVLCAVIGLLPVWLLQGGVIWMAGAAAAWCSRLPAVSRCLKTIAARVLAPILLCAALLDSELRVVALGDLGLGLVVALTLPVMAHLPSPGGWFASVARGSSEISYTLYLTHFPFLTLVIMTSLAPLKWPPGLLAAGLYVALLSAAIVWASAVWWCFERNTDRVYSMLDRMLIAPRVAVAES